MSKPPSTKLVSCPQCGAKFRRAIVLFDGREIFANNGCICEKCDAERAAAVAMALDARAQHLERWKARVPDDYHRAVPERVSAALKPALAWRPVDGCRRLGIHGPAGTGKSMAVALTVREAGISFQWTNGFAARSLYNKSVSGSDDDRREAGRKWIRIRDSLLLVLDDVDKGNFTEAWSGALFDLLEHRNSNRLATVWTANLGPGGIAAKIARTSGDPEQAAAIERRLCSGAMLIGLKQKGRTAA